MSRCAVVLFGHGSRDPRWAEPLQSIATLLRQRLPNAAVSLAFLEIMSPDLNTAATLLIEGGATSLCIVPVFLGQGGHVREDLPRLVDSLREKHPMVELRLSTAVGENHGVLDAIAAYCADEVDDCGG